MGLSDKKKFFWSLDKKNFGKKFLPTVTGKKNGTITNLDIFASFWSWAKKFWENISEIHKFFWENFGHAPTTPKPTNQKMAIFGYLEKWPKRGVDLHF